jgi:hypothetical protein
MTMTEEHKTPQRFLPSSGDEVPLSRSWCAGHYDDDGVAIDSRTKRR